MKQFKFHMIFTLSTLSLLVVACQKENDGKTEELWKRLPVVERKATDGKVIPTELILDCRRSHTIGNQALHYYYSVVADPAKSKVDTGIDTTTTTITDAQMNLEIFSSGSVSKEIRADEHTTITSIPVDLVIVRNTRDEQVSIARANKATIDRIENFYSNNPFFGKVREGQEVFKFTKMDGKIKNLSKLNLPGLKPGDRIECK